MTGVSRALRQQLTLYLIFAVYQLIRLVGISDLPLNLWQQVYFGNVIKDSLGLFATGFLVLVVLKLIKSNRRLGPTIISSANLKKIAYISMGLFWLAIVIHILFDSFKLVLPWPALPAYQFADFLDETIAHIFLMVPLIGILFVISFLEIERPFTKSLSRPIIAAIVTGNFLMGILMGLNLTEGDGSLFTSWPLTGVLWISLLYFTVKHRLDLRFRPWSLAIISGSLAAWLAFLAWVLINPDIPQLFSQFE